MPFLCLGRAQIVVAAAVLNGCIFDGKVPEDPNALPVIACATDSDCPDDWACRQSIGQCMPASLLGAAEALSLTDEPQIIPAVGRLGTRFRVSFHLSASPLEAPQVALDLPNRSPGLALIEEDGERFHYEYVVDGSEAGGLFGLSARVTDRSGEVSTLPLGALAIDFRTPELVVSDLSSAIVNGGEVAVNLRFDEELQSPPVVEAETEGGARLFFIEQDDADGDASTFTFGAAVSPGVADGVYVLRVEAADLAGNTAAFDDVEQLTVDTKAPVLAGPGTIEPAERVRPKDLMRVSIVLSESPMLTPRLTAFDDDGVEVTVLERSSDLGRQQVFTAVAPEPANGDQMLSLVLSDVVDAAGNRLEAVVVGDLMIDATAPQPVQWSQTAVAAVPGFPVGVAFSVSEPLLLTPVLRFAGAAVETQPTSDPLRFEAQLDVAGTLTDGTFPFQVTLTDVAGNIGVHTPGQLEVDTVPPRLLDVTFTPPVVALGTTAFALVTVDEVLSAPPELEWSATTGGLSTPTFLGASGLGYLFSWEIDENAPAGMLLLDRVDLVDRAQNAATVMLASTLSSMSGLFVDNVRPEVSALASSAATFSAQPGHNVVTVTFDVTDDAQPQNPYVTVGGQRMMCGTYAAVSPHFTCTLELTGDEQEGAQPILVSVVDGAGNEGFSSATVHFDFTGPEVVADASFVDFDPGLGNLNPAPQAAKSGTRVLVGFRLSETIDMSAPPEVAATWTAPSSASSAPPSLTVLDFDAQESPDGSWRAAHVLGADAIEGSYTVAVTATDSVGNTATSAVQLPEPGLVVDTSAPVAPLVDLADAIVLHRNPWGSEATAGASELSVSAEPGAIPEGAHVIFFTASTEPRTELGRAPREFDGGLISVPLLPAQTGKVWVLVLDHAGNASAPVLIRDVDMTFSLGGKVRGSLAQNPNVLRERRYHTVSGEGVLSPEVVNTSNAVFSDGDTVRVHGAGRWRPLNTLAPFEHYESTATYDTRRGRMMLHGGLTDDPGASQTGTIADMWELFDGRWRLVKPLDIEADGNPPPACGHRMTYDVHRGVAVLFGGLVGCRSSGTYRGDTWEFDGTSWILRTPTDPEGDGNPEPRMAAGLVYDETRAVTLLHGGEDESGGFADLWAWNGESWKLLQDQDAGTVAGPGTSVGHLFTWDPEAERALCFPCGPGFDAMWAWDGGGWQALPEADPEGDGRPATTWWWSPSFGFDRNRNRLVLVESDVWEWDGSSWQNLGAVPGQVSRGGPTTYLAAEGELFSYEGHGDGYSADVGLNLTTTDEFGDPYPHDVPWSWNGERWNRHALWGKRAKPDETSSPGGMALPPPRERPGFVANEKTGVIEIGGSPYVPDFGDQPWVFFDGRTQPRQVASVRDTSGDGEPVADTTESLWWDPVGESVVTFDWDGKTRWVHDGVEWHPQTVRDPNADGQPSVSFVGWEPTHQTFVGFAQPPGCCGAAQLSRAWRLIETARDANNNPTWEWRSIPVTDPEGDGNPRVYSSYSGWALYDARVEYDRTMNRLLLFEMATAQSTVEVWEWTGSSWRHQEIVDPEGDGNPPARQGAVVSFDPGTGDVVMYGGQWQEDYNYALADVWRWHGRTADEGSWRRQALVDPNGEGNPGHHVLGAMAIDPSSKQVVYYGGLGENDVDSDAFFFLDTGATARPSAVLHAATGSVDLHADSELLLCVVRAVAGGDGLAAGAPLAGAELLVWQAGAWRVLATNTAASASPAVLEGTLSGREVREAVMIRPGRETLVAIAPRGTNGDRLAEVSLDSVEVRLVYRLPEER